MWQPAEGTSVADRVVVEPASGPFRAAANVPGDKSLSHRALILSAMAEGTSEVEGLGPGADVAATFRAVQALGVTRNGQRLVSPGPSGWRDPGAAIDCGNSGTTMRLLAGALAGLPFRVQLIGDESLSRRPMRRLLPTLTALGIEIALSPDGTAPIETGGAVMVGADVVTDLASAQVRSAFELAAVQAAGRSEIDGPPGFRDHTERWLEALGLGERLTGTRFRIDPGRVPANRYAIPSDPSSAAYLWASAAIVEGSAVATPEVSLNPGRIGFLEVLEAMGARVSAEVTGEIHGDPVGTVLVEGAGLGSADVAGRLVPAAIDELPLVAIVAAYGNGTTMVRDAADLRTKESDRIAATVGMIRGLGGHAEPMDDGFVVTGTGSLGTGSVAAGGDHRIAMAAGVAAVAADGPVAIEGASAAAVSWPTFYRDLEALWSSR